MAELKSDPVMLEHQRPPHPSRQATSPPYLDNGTQNWLSAKTSIVFPTCAGSSKTRVPESADINAFIGAIVGRHTDIQHGKFDRGRRKMPWIELNDGRITLTMTRAGGMNREATLPEHIQVHPYRLNAADAFNFGFGEGVAVMMDTSDISARKLIDKLVPDPRWGSMRGLLCTTYELGPDFLEMDFLPSVFGLGAWE